MFNPKKKNVKILAFALVMTFISQLFWPAQNASADAPQFNHMANDEELLKGSSNLNLTDPIAATDPIIGNAGDTFKGFI